MLDSGTIRVIKKGLLARMGAEPDRIRFIPSAQVGRYSEDDTAGVYVMFQRGNDMRYVVIPQDLVQKDITAACDLAARELA